MRGDDLAIVDQQAGLALDQSSEAAIAAGDFRNQVIEQEKRRNAL
jgi:hypothetical protein